MKKIRVLVVDDSALIRSLLKKGLEQDPMIEVVGMARDPYEARDLLVQLRPDVLTLDVEMPKMDGVTFLRKMMARLPTPTVMLSSLTEKGARITLEALEAGAVEIMTKPANLVDGVPEIVGELHEAVKRASRAKVKARDPAQARPAEVSALVDNSTDKVIVIGASTGGVEAIARILPQFPRTSPGIVIVEHMPPGYTKAFAERLNKTCSMEVREATARDRVRNGLVLVAPGGGNHLEVTRFGGQYRLGFVPGRPDERHVPAVDVLFRSTASAAGANAVGVLMTGMGSDGAEGLLEMRKAGGRTFAQDEQSCVVFGMPKAALELGAAERAVPLDELPRCVLESFAQQRSA